MDRLFKYCEKYKELANVSKHWKEQIPGGLASGKNPKDFDPHQLTMVIKVEMEHTKDPKLALEIAMDHLTEDPKYYDRLDKMESEFEGDK